MNKQVTYNQHPEQKARDIIDQKLEQAGWTIQSVKHFNPNSSLGVAVREYPTDSGPVDYLLFVDREPVAIIEAKEENFGHKLNTVEEQSARYADSELKHIPQADSLLCGRRSERTEHMDAVCLVRPKLGEVAC